MTYSGDSGVICRSPLYGCEFRVLLFVYDPNPESPVLFNTVGKQKWTYGLNKCIFVKVS